MKWMKRVALCGVPLLALAMGLVATPVLLAYRANRRV